MARFRKVAHRITGDRKLVRCHRVGYNKDDVVVDDTTRLDNDELLADEQKEPMISFLSGAIAFFNGSGDRVPAGDERPQPRIRLQDALQGLPRPGAAAHPHQPYAPKTNSKDETFIQTISKE